MLWDIWFLLLISTIGLTLVGLVHWVLGGDPVTPTPEALLVAGLFPRIPLHNRYRTRGRHRAR